MDSERNVFLTYHFNNLIVFKVIVFKILKSK